MIAPASTGTVISLGEGICGEWGGKDYFNLCPLSLQTLHVETTQMSSNELRF